MVLIIATMSLCLFIIAIQHLYNWGMRKIIDIMEEQSFGPVIALSTLVFGVTFLLFKFLLEINK